MADNTDSIFDRRISMETIPVDDTLLIKGRLEDIRLGEELHVIEVEMLFSVLDGEIKKISGSMPVIPMEECALGLESLNELPGHRIKPGFTDTVRNTVGSNCGCSHLSSLVMNMANVSVQGRGAFARKFIENEEELMLAMEKSALDLGLIDSCVCWREDGPIVRRWRERQTGDE